MKIEYCPENTCEVFQAKIEHKNELADFTVLYLFYASGKTALLFPDNKGLTSLERITIGAMSVKDAYSGQCSGTELEMVSCILKNIVKKYKISGTDVRFDEGGKYSTEIDFENYLTVWNLERVENWRKTNAP